MHHFDWLVAGLKRGHGVSLLTSTACCGLCLKY